MVNCSSLGAGSMDAWAETVVYCRNLPDPFCLDTWICSRHIYKHLEDWSHTSAVVICRRAKNEGSAYAREALLTHMR